MIYILLCFCVITCGIAIYKLYEKNKFLSAELKKFNNFEVKQNVGFFEKILEPISDIYIKYNFILYFIVSIFFYVIASFDYKNISIFQDYVIESHTINNIATSIATVILSSGVLVRLQNQNIF